jgi:hypothetical protein
MNPNTFVLEIKEVGRISFGDMEVLWQKICLFQQAVGNGGSEISATDDCDSDIFQHVVSGVLGLIIKGN